MPPAPEVPPRRERWGRDRTEMGSRWEQGGVVTWARRGRDGIDMGVRHFLPRNHGLRYLPALIAVFVFSHAVSHAVLQKCIILMHKKPVSGLFAPRFSGEFCGGTRVP